MIVGTAGHVDHGKTALVKALTGVDTDRLPEEKRRGITLELGFAHLTLPDGPTLGVIDVPGHERFVKAMAAGAGGIDLALLVVAADEGVMPQTREHVDICSLLGVRAGLLVVTKADLLPGLGEGWLELLEADLRALTVGTFLEGAPLLAVSAKTGEGLEGLRAALSGLVASLAERTADGPLFLPVDRAFSVKGFGCVLTGTLLSGRLRLEDELSLLPGLSGPLRARGLQVHGKAVPSAQAGERVAVNVVALETAQVHRGMALTRVGELPEVRALDVEALRPGESAFAQLRLGAPVAALVGQRFIVRGTTAVPGRGATIGGGRVLALNPPRRRRGAGQRLGELAAGDLEARITWLLTEAGYRGLTAAQLYAQASAPSKELARGLERLATQGRAVLVDKESRRFLGQGVLRGLEARALSRLEAFHAERPELDGLSREELRQRLEVPHERTFLRLLTGLTEAGKVELVGELLRLPGRGRAYSEAAASLKGAIAKALSGAALAPPTSTELAAQLKSSPERVAELLKALVAEGSVVRAAELHFDAAAVQQLSTRLVDFLEAHRAISTQQFKDLTGQSRKFAIPLAEYFDREKVTLRVGEQRVLRAPRKGA